MGSTEALFQQLIDRTGDMLQIIQYSPQNQPLEAMDPLFAERELLLKQLDENLQQEANIGKYRSLYDKLKVKEDELQKAIQASLQETEAKIKDIRKAKTISTQYESYLRQTPYGAFFDKKK
ncbi:hypothetical protein [Paenibacillus anseongense]|uniref:hypothetical protein n=1 Tax=Paenibacillus TaxID=44249 RepID=UPI002DBD79A4|nr:hypothetical protein [Paenibacillus anseongense]MEC0267602.1 hypothetical protein [Paenibacillus anseongense]